MDIQDVRRENLRALVLQWESAVNLAGAMGLANSSYIGHLLKGRKPFTEKTARMIEQKLKIEALWLDRRHTEVGGPVQFDADILQKVVNEISKHSLPPDKLASIVLEVYMRAVKDGGVDPKQIERLVQIAK